MRALAVIAAAAVLFAAVFAPSWLLDRLCARWYGTLTGPYPRPGADGERAWRAVMNVDKGWWPSQDPCVVHNPQRGGTP